MPLRFSASVVYVILSLLGNQFGVYLKELPAGFKLMKEGYTRADKGTRTHRCRLVNKQHVN